VLNSRKKAKDIDEITGFTSKKASFTTCLFFLILLVIIPSLTVEKVKSARKPLFKA
jgi:hypothetical protein